MADKESLREDKLLTLDEVAERLTISRRTVERYIKKGWLTAVKYERAIRVRASEVERFLNEREQR